MALSGSVLSTNIRAALASEFPDAFPDTGAAKAAWDVIAEQIVLHIQTAGVVNVASVSGVTVGGGVSGQGLGTIT